MPEIPQTKRVDLPAVTIGMPIYNGERSIRRALESLLAQAFGAFELIISDNASTDETGVICENYSRRDQRIRYIRQEINRGAHENFLAVLEEAAAPYFMWAAGDDVWDRDFIAANIDVLGRYDDVVASVSRVTFLDGMPHQNEQAGTFSLMGSPRANIARYLRAPQANSRYYSVFRTTVLRRSVRARSFAGYDWAVMAATLKFGKHYEVPRVLLRRNARGLSGAIAPGKWNASPIGRVFPMWPLTYELLTDSELPKSARMLSALAKHNWYYFWLGLRYRLRSDPRA